MNRVQKLLKKEDERWTRGQGKALLDWIMAAYTPEEIQEAIRDVPPSL